MTDPAAFAVELGRALTGEALPLRSPIASDLVSELGHFGWNPEQLAELRTERQDAGEPWPFPVKRDVVSEVGFAVFQARLADLRERLGLTGLQPQPRADRPLDPEERRLESDRPPHWG